MLRKACSNMLQLYVRRRGPDQSARSGRSTAPQIPLGLLVDCHDKGNCHSLPAERQPPDRSRRKRYTNSPLMTHPRNSLQNYSNQSPPCDGSHVPGFNLYLNDSSSVSRYLRLALQTLSEHRLIPPDVKRLTQVVEAALSAQAIFFASALHRPDTIELHQFFETFVLSCIIPAETRSFS